MTLRLPSCAPLHGLPVEDLLPRSMRMLKVRQRRRALLDTRPAHFAPIIDHVARLRSQRPEWEVPDLDPASGGVYARVLFLMEKPGPMTEAETGSGFISVNNDDRTAEAVHRFLTARGLRIELCLFANVIPWWDGARKISREQRDHAIPATTQLLGLMRELRAIVLIGTTAQRVWARLRLAAPDGVTLYASAHPSPIVRARYPDRWAAIPQAWPAPSTVA